MDEGLSPDIIISPQLAQPIGHCLYQLGLRDIRTLTVFKGADGKSLAFKYAYEKEIPGSKVLFIDDILSNGTTTRWARQLVENHGGKLIGAAFVADRQQIPHSDLPTPSVATLTTIKNNSWSEEECKITPGLPCHSDVPMNSDFGHGKEWLEKHT